MIQNRTIKLGISNCNEGSTSNEANASLTAVPSCEDSEGSAPDSVTSVNTGISAALVATNGWQWTTNAAGDAWSLNCYALNGGGTAVLYTDTNGQPY